MDSNVHESGLKLEDMRELSPTTGFDGLEVVSYELVGERRWVMEYELVYINKNIPGRFWAYIQYASKDDMGESANEYPLRIEDIYEVFPKEVTKTIYSK